MTLLAAVGSRLILLAFGCIAAAFGSRMLRWTGVSLQDGLERTLFGAGLFLALFQILVFLLSLFGFLNAPVVIVIVVLALLAAGNEWKQVSALAGKFFARLRNTARDPLTSLLMISTVGFLAIDSLMSAAPVASSDAMMYHFAVPMLEAGKRWEPIFWLPFSFYTGQAHSLIQLGLTLHSELLATGSVFLAGALSMVSLFVLTRRLASERWAWIAALAFLVSPMVYWQMCTSGCPDIWIAFFVTMAVLAAARGIETRQSTWWYLASIFAGAAAGVKYTSWVVPAALVVCCLLKTRSWRQSSLCGVCSFFCGALPLIRNVWWSSDPFFPFLTRYLNPSNTNPFTLSLIMGNLTPVDMSRSLTGLIKYPFLIVLKQDAYGGFGHWFGPLVILLAPLLLLVRWRNPLVWMGSAMWAAILLANEFTAQQPRYLLAAFPVAIALVFSGAARVMEWKSRIVTAAVAASIALFLLFGAASEAAYSKDFLPVVAGRETREAFLTRMAGDYPAASFVTESLKSGNGKAMVFFRLVYYVRVPVEIGTPEESWLMNTEKITDADSLLQFLNARGIRWVVKSPDYPYPASLTAAFQKLEGEGDLRPVFSREASTFSNFRMFGERVKFKMVILEVTSPGGMRPPNQ
jgi:4-amino-4-deoxy-L-arabinose transferase-like glycosyltransferase